MSEDNGKSAETPSGVSETSEIIAGYPSVDQFTKEGFKTLMEAIRHSNALPAGRDWNFYTLSDSFSKIINNEGSRVLRLMNQIMRCNEIESNIRNRILDEKTELVVESNDIILEKVANNIDEMNGIRKSVPEPVIIQTVSAEIPVNGSWNRSAPTSITVNSTGSKSLSPNCIKLITGKNIVRPQNFFKDKIDNRNNQPWCPRITYKPNSIKPLAIFLEEYENGQEYSHPYEFELDRFAPTDEQLLEEIPEFPATLSETPLIEVDKPEQLDDLVETLRNCKEFAVDLEHHSYRSFMGITCLMQISTKDKDYLIDTLALRDKLCILNEVFTRNTIVKIFHGADHDIQWLQRDLSIYVVNMFDTHLAAKALEYSGLSLAFLMKKFCNILPNKQFQLADWRIRPLPEEFKTYAREDTHYLIYIYKMLKRDLLLKANKSDNLVRSVIDQSNELCKKRYFKPVLLDDSHLVLYRKCKKSFDNRQLYALKEIFAWRDSLAREEDESLGYVLPNHMLLQISETLPREMQGILACCNPIPPLVRSHLLELHQIVLKAREQPLEKAILKENITGRGILKDRSKVNVDSPLHCPHDLSKSNEFRDNLPTLLNNNDLKTENRNVAMVSLAIEKSSSYSIFGNRDETFNEKKAFKELRGFTYLSPYQRYKLVKPFVEAEEEAAIAKKQEEEAKINEQEEAKKVEESRTDEERIASVRNHFLELSKKFSEELETKRLEEEKKEREKEKSLIEMGGSRKRKREKEENDDEVQFMYEEFETTLHKPILDVPHMYGNFRKTRPNNKTRRKRKHDEIDSFNSQGQQGEDFPRPKKKAKKNKQNKNKQNPNQSNQLNQQNYPRQQDHPNKQHQHGQQNSRQHKNSNQQNQPYQQNHPNQPKNKQKNKAKKNFKKQNRSNDKQGQGSAHNQDQGSGNFVPYDYASVDFRQFQGGAGSATGAINIQSKFKARGRKKMGNKGTRSSTFSNSQNRGRGRGNGR